MPVEIRFSSCTHRIGIAEADSGRKLACPFCTPAELERLQRELAATQKALERAQGAEADCAALLIRAERAEADLAAARNDVVLAQAHGARWLAELQKAEADREQLLERVFQVIREAADPRDPKFDILIEQIRRALAKEEKPNDA